MCAAPTRRSSRCDCWQSQGRETQRPESDLTRIRPMPPQMGHVVIALTSLAQSARAGCGGKDGADRGKADRLPGYLMNSAIPVATRTKKVTTPKNTIVLRWFLFDSFGSVDLYTTRLPSRCVGL